MNDTRVDELSGMPFLARTGQKKRFGPTLVANFEVSIFVFNHLVRLENCTISGQGCVQNGIFPAFNKLDEFC
jgi:hypothetical protein